MTEGPDRRLTLSEEELRFIQLLVARNDLAVSAEIAEIADQRRGRLVVTMFDKTGMEAGRHELGPPPYELP